jgi:hypothetical protein
MVDVTPTWAPVRTDVPRQERRPMALPRSAQHTTRGRLRGPAAGARWMVTGTCHARQLSLSPFFLRFFPDSPNINFSGERAHEALGCERGVWTSWIDLLAPVTSRPMLSRGPAVRYRSTASRDTSRRAHMAQWATATAHVGAAGHRSIAALAWRSGQQQPPTWARPAIAASQRSRGAVGSGQQQPPTWARPAIAAGRARGPAGHVAGRQVPSGKLRPGTGKVTRRRTARHPASTFQGL